MLSIAAALLGDGKSLEVFQPPSPGGDAQYQTFQMTRGVKAIRRIPRLQGRRDKVGRFGELKYLDRRDEHFIRCMRALQRFHNTKVGTFAGSDQRMNLATRSVAWSPEVAAERFANHIEGRSHVFGAK